jgi:hypothetical protein
MKIGDIDVTNSILNLEHDMEVLNQILNHIYQNNSMLKRPSKEELKQFRKNALEKLKKKYPSMGIKDDEQ